MIDIQQDVLADIKIQVCTYIHTYSIYGQQRLFLKKIIKIWIIKIKRTT